MPDLALSYIIIGAGAFGASTALYLSRQKPSPSIILIDRSPYPCPVAASHDINKIVRSDYGDIFYCKLGLKALEKWRKDPLFEVWFHQSGLLKATDHSTDLVEKTLDNYKELGVDVGAELLTPEDLKTRFKGLYSETDLTDVESLLWNPSAGWAEAATALKYTLDAVTQNGVHYITADVSKLIIEDGACKGVRTEDGRTYTAKKTILCTGAYTAKLMADSAPTQSELQVGNRITACGVCEAAVNLNPEQVDKFKDVPAFVLDANKTQGEAIPPTPKNQLKFIRDMPFKHTIDYPAIGQRISVPFTDTERSQWTTPDRMPASIKAEIATVMKGIYGKHVEGMKVDEIRFCWDAITPDNNWYITPHPRCPNLYIATAGSFHGWKFLPIIGEYVVRMLKGELSDEERSRWEWDRGFEGYPRNALLPEREMRDLGE